ncbi:conserved exported protein of unknown function [Methylocella tundrae]|uniref:DUF2147 domain-containing protein n=1 Tax=Methylocella tundrae TaxID=227605 RepID=A0A4U8YTY8_METTU|nr:conserved exported protein of unknown function [Methylocella tundrae]
MYLAGFRLDRFRRGGAGGRGRSRAFLPATASLALAIAAAMSSPASAAPEPPTGLWFTKNDGSIIKIAPCGADYCGTLIWLKEPNGFDGKPRIDKYNEDPAKRGRSLVGIEILIDLAADNDRWRGKAYNPEDGKTYDITFKVVPDKMTGDKAEIEGCILKILCKTDVFTKTQAVPKDATPAP